MNKVKRLAKRQERRKFRVRAKLKGSDRVRLSVFRSNLYFRVQAIDDSAGKTIASAWSGELSGDESSPVRGCAAAAEVGRLIAERLLASGVSAARLDRGDYRYHGRVKAFADGARGAGLDL